MNWLDIFFLTPIIWGAYLGFKKGLIAQILGLVSIIAGIWMGTQHPEHAISFLSDKIDVKYLSVTSFILTFTIVVISGAIITKVFEKVINFIQLKFLNKIGGVILGSFKVISLLLVFVFVLESWDFHSVVLKKSVKDESIIYPILYNSSKLILPKIESNEIIDLSEIKKEFE